MSKITSQILQKVAPGTPKAKRDRFLSYFNSVLPKYNITTELRVAAFLTTVCFESDYFKALVEYASGWAYDISKNRKKALELGNTEVGDGPKYKGRGGIETTGKRNYKRLSDKLGVDFVKNPELLGTEKYFVEAACVFWEDNNFNSLADKGKIIAIQNITNRGSANKPAKDLSDRIQIYQNVLHILPDDFVLDGNAKSDVSASEAPNPIPDEPTNDSKAPEPNGSTVNQEVNVTGDSANVVVPAPQTPASTEPVTIKGVTTSLWTKLMAGVTALTGLGINFANAVETKLENITLNQVFILALGVGLVILAVWYYQKRQAAMDVMNHALINAAADQAKNTVNLQK